MKMLARAVTMAQACAVPFARNQMRTFAVALDAKTFVMPKLSPKMTQGRVSKWHCGEGDRVKANDIICEISTTELLDDADRTGRRPTSEHILQIEAQADMYIAKEFITETDNVVPVGTPIAVTCEEETTIPTLQDFTPEKAFDLIRPERFFTYEAHMKD